MTKPKSHLKYWEIIADNLKKRGWSLGYVSAVDSCGRTIFVADAHRDGKRFVIELESADSILRRFSWTTRALDKTYFDDCGGGGSGSPFPIRFK
jgi:hypothetical protein